MQLLRRLVGLSPRRLGFELGPVRARFLVYNWRWTGFPPGYFSFPPFSIIPLVFQTNIRLNQEDERAKIGHLHTNVP